VVDLSLPADGSWPTHLDNEINSAHPGGWRGYLQGSPPSHEHLSDARGVCLKHVHDKGEEPDRRLWTWEARSFASIESNDVETIALSPEAVKEFYSRIRAGDAPLAVPRIIAGRVDANGVHLFQEDEVLRAFEGRER
jgi:hypothetical protein